MRTHTHVYKNKSTPEFPVQSAAFLQGLIGGAETYSCDIFKEMGPIQVMRIVYLFVLRSHLVREDVAASKHDLDVVD